MRGEAHRVIVVGGGAAGLMAAGQAAEAGASVLLLEKMPRLARKLAITGKGRCNLTNTAPLPEFLAHFGPGGRFLRQAFARFFRDDLLAFFEGLGLALVTERGGRVFPASGKATELVEVLSRWAEGAGVTVRTGAPVAGLLVEDSRCVGLRLGRERLRADAVVLATGGASYPRTGSTGDGYGMVAALGHRVVPVRPALVPLESAGEEAGRMAGLGLRNVRARLLVDGKRRAEGFGELEFTETGVGGPVVLTMSGMAVDALVAGQVVRLVIDLKPALDEAKLDARLLRDLQARAAEPLSSVLRGLLPREMVPVCLAQNELVPNRPAQGVTAKERRRLGQWLKGFSLDITGHRPLDEAIVSAGGVDTREVDPRTMESRLVSGLFLAGELLDIQGDTGGFNLQAAFSTGWLAGRAAASPRTDTGSPSAGRRSP